MPARSRSNALLIWWITSGSVLDASLSVSSNRLNPAASGRDHRSRRDRETVFKKPSCYLISSYKVNKINGYSMILLIFSTF